MSEKVVIYDHLIKVVHKLYCDDCNIEMKPTGICYMSRPRLLEYYCPQCNMKINKTEEYPWTEIVGEIVDGE